ncbi:MAG: DUF6056 family protein [Dysgonomonas sp.]|nr:DUF6056 family protein [Dysgonomonas sp.]
MKLSKTTFLNKRSLGVILLISFIYIMMYILNYNYPINTDDWDYRCIFPTNERLDSLSGLLTSQYNHYFMWGGRTVVHVICQVLLMLDFWLTCAINTLAYVALVYLMYRIANKNNIANPFVLFLCHVAVWFLQPIFCETVLWKTGAANYLWGTLIILSFIYFYYTYYWDKERKEGAVRTILFFMGGIIAGWTNENMGVALIFYIIASFFLYRKEGMVIPRWTISGLIGAVIGCVVMLIAPGNYVRLEGAVNGFDGTALEMYLFNWKVLFLISRLSILPLIIAYITGILIYRYQKKRNIWRDRAIRSSLLFFVTAFVAFVALMAASISESRALFGLIILLIISVAQIYANIDFKVRTLKIVNIIMLSVLLIYYIVDYTWKYQTLKIVSTAWEERFLQIEEVKNKGIDTIVFTNRFQIQGKYGISDLSDDPEFSVNKVCAKYYGFRYMRAISVEKKN